MPAKAIKGLKNNTNASSQDIGTATFVFCSANDLMVC